MGKFFTVTVRPELPIATLIANDGTDKPFAATDLFFDWAAFDIPKGAALLRHVTLLVRGEDGSPQTARDFQLYFAKSHSGGTAPSSLGTGNATVDGTGYYQQIIGALLLNSGDFRTNLDFGVSVVTTGYGGNTDQIPNMVLEGEPESGTNVGYDKIYVAGVGGASNTWDFSTGVLTTQAETASTSAAKTITTDGTHATKALQKGDVVAAAGPAGGSGSYKTVGTVTSVNSTTSVTFDAIAEALEDNDELVVTNPITMILSFER
tara:strand:- start:275 stop:1063 length:789 start_codon:yes stop_codon:yes gene_type:complete